MTIIVWILFGIGNLIFEITNKPSPQPSPSGRGGMKIKKN